MGFKHYGVNSGGLPMHIIGEFLDNIPIPIFVETGSAAGDSIKEASKHFKECFTIELNSGRQKVDESINNIEWLDGNTIEVLPSIVKTLIANKGASKDHRYALWFLDAHFDGDKPKDSPYKDCYVLEELEIIAGAYREDSIILIDDARLFYGNPPQPNTASEWPGVQEIFVFMKEHFPYHFATVIDDYLLCIPDRIKWVFDKLWMENYNKRYPSEANKLKSQVKDVYKALIEYMG